MRHRLIAAVVVLAAPIVIAQRGPAPGEPARRQANSGHPEGRIEMMVRLRDLSPQRGADLSIQYSFRARCQALFCLIGPDWHPLRPE